MFISPLSVAADYSVIFNFIRSNQDVWESFLLNIEVSEMFCEGTVVKWCLADPTVQRIECELHVGFVNDVL